MVVSTAPTYEPVLAALAARAHAKSGRTDHRAQIGAGRGCRRRRRDPSLLRTPRHHCRARPQPGRHRLYPEETVTTLRVIKAAQSLGFTLDEVAELLEAGRHHHGAPAGLQSRTEAKLAEVDRKLAGLQVIRASLILARDAGCDDLVRCAESDCCPIPFVQIGLPPESSNA